MEHRVFNFSSGPATIDPAVLNEIREELLNYHGCGMSILEMNHVGRNFSDILQETRQLFTQVLDIDDAHCVFFVTGGGWMNFSMIPVNFLNTPHAVCDYADTGVWANFALQEAKKFGRVHVCVSGAPDYCHIPPIRQQDLHPDSAYLYLCTNNTSYGTRISMDKIPQDLHIPLIADITSNVLAETIDINRFSLAFAAAQKNMGPSGVSVVFANKEFLQQHHKQDIPRVLSYYDYYISNSTFSTPPTFSIYMMNLSLKRLIQNGGVSAMEQKNKQKAAMLYAAIDASPLFFNKIPPQDRSLTNVVFTTGDHSLDKRFIAFAQAHDIVNIEGYKSVGGMRAALYNAVELFQVQHLIACMQSFEKEVQR